MDDSLFDSFITAVKVAIDDNINIEGVNSNTDGAVRNDNCVRNEEVCQETSVTESSDHVTESSDHVTESPDHLTESSDHVTESSDHVTESSDHMTDSSDHVTQTSCNGTASSDPTESCDNHQYTTTSSDQIAESSDNVAKLSSDPPQALDLPTQSYDRTNSTPTDPHTDYVPVEDIPVPHSSPPDAPGPDNNFTPEGYTPTLKFSAQMIELGRSPSFLDRSLDFIKREIDVIRYKIVSRPLLTHEQWFNLFNSDGQLLKSQLFDDYLMNYDWPGELLQEGWKYLFGYYDINSNHTERVYLDKQKREELDTIVRTWSDGLEMEFTLEEGDLARIKKLLYLVNKDVPRTDRDHEFYRDHPGNADILRDLLVTYCFSQPEVGYVQGMNELLSMFIVTIDDKVAAYWCFYNYITRNRLFYISTGLMSKLNGIAQLLHTHDKEVYDKLVTLECTDMLFCQRWIILGFKRESKTFDIAIKIFTLLNQVRPTHYLVVQGLGRCELLSLDMFVAIAVLMRYRSLILSYSDQTDMYRWVSQLKIADMTVIHHAKQLYDSYANDSL